MTTRVTIVGIDTPDEGALRHLYAEFGTESVSFFRGGASPLDVTKTLVTIGADKKPDGRGALLILAEFVSPKEVETYSRLKAAGVEVRTGYTAQMLNLLEPEEIREWAATGTVTEKAQTDEDLIASLLGLDHEEEAQPVSKPEAPAPDSSVVRGLFPQNTPVTAPEQERPATVTPIRPEGGIPITSRRPVLPDDGSLNTRTEPAPEPIRPPEPVQQPTPAPSAVETRSEAPQFPGLPDPKLTDPPIFGAPPVPAPQYVAPEPVPEPTPISTPPVQPSPVYTAPPAPEPPVWPSRIQEPAPPIPDPVQRPVLPPEPQVQHQSPAPEPVPVTDTPEPLWFDQIADDQITEAAASFTPSAQPAPQSPAAQERISSFRPDPIQVPEPHSSPAQEVPLPIPNPDYAAPVSEHDTATQGPLVKQPNPDEVPPFMEGMTREQRARQNEERTIKAAYGNVRREPIGTGEGKVVYITGSHGGAGKTTVTWVLANTAAMVARHAQSSKIVWLIEVDYRNPKLQERLGIDTAHLGNVTREIEALRRRGTFNSQDLAEIVKGNTIIQKDTGLRVLVCPYDMSGVSQDALKYAIHVAARVAASSQGYVFMDAGTLTSGNMDNLDQSLANRIAHHAVVVSDRTHESEMLRACKILTDTGQQFPKHIEDVHVFLNRANPEHVRSVQEDVVPYRIDGSFPIFDEIDPANGSGWVGSASSQVLNAMVVRAGNILPHLGVSEASSVFSDRTPVKHPRGIGRLLRRVGSR